MLKKNRDYLYLFINDIIFIYNKMEAVIFYGARLLTEIKISQSVG